jgi:hypothetical protein
MIITGLTLKSTDIPKMNQICQDVKDDVNESSSPTLFAGIITLLIVAGVLIIFYSLTFLYKTMHVQSAVSRRSCHLWSSYFNHSIWSQLWCIKMSMFVSFLNLYFLQDLWYRSLFAIYTSQFKCLQICWYHTFINSSKQKQKWNENSNHINDWIYSELMTQVLCFLFITFFLLHFIL